MTPLRNQLLAAQSAYQRIRFDGDLAGMLKATPNPHFIGFAPRLRIACGLAAAILLIALGHNLQIGRDVFTPPSLSAVKLDLSLWEKTAASLTGVAELPKKAEMANAIQTLTPPQTSDLLSIVEKPLYESGNFIVTIGKDLAHHADALFHLM